MNLEPFALERWMTTWETEVGFDLAESGIYPLSTAELLDLLPSEGRDQALQDLVDLRLIYSEARGTRALRELIAATYLGLSEHDVFVTTGAIEANFLLFTSLLRAGDHVIAIYPAYQQLYSVAEALGCQVDRWVVRDSGDGFHFDVDDLESILRPSTRMIVINSPHNPTGAVLSEVDLRRIYDLAESVDAIVLSDEAYRWIEGPGSEKAPGPMRNRGPKAISVGTVSKPFGLPGLRIGWIAATEEIIQRGREVRNYTSLSPTGLSDSLATIAFRCRDQLIERQRAIVAENLEVADAWFLRNADLVTWHRPSAGLLGLVRYSLDVPSTRLADHLAAEYSVMLAPGSAFGYEGYLRMGVGQRPDIFAEGLERTAVCLRALSNR